MHGHSSRLLISINVVKHERLEIAIEDQTDELGVSVHDRATGITPDNIRGADKVKRRREVQISFVPDPGFGKIEGRFIMLFGRALVQPGELRFERDMLPVFLIALYLPEGQAQSKRGIGISAGPLNDEASFANLRVGLLFDLS